MTSHGVEWDEDRGGPRNPENLISFPKDGMVHQSTVNVIPWADCGAHKVGSAVERKRIFPYDEEATQSVRTPHADSKHKITCRCSLCMLMHGMGAHAAVHLPTFYGASAGMLETWWSGGADHSPASDYFCMPWCTRRLDERDRSG